MKACLFIINIFLGPREVFLKAGSALRLHCTVWLGARGPDQHFLAGPNMLLKPVLYIVYLYIIVQYMYTEQGRICC